MYIHKIECQKRIFRLPVKVFNSYSIQSLPAMGKKLLKLEEIELCASID